MRFSKARVSLIPAVLGITAEAQGIGVIGGDFVICIGQTRRGTSAKEPNESARAISAAARTNRMRIHRNAKFFLKEPPMTGTQAIKASLATSDMLWGMLTEDLSDNDLLVRPVQGANHIA